MGAFLEISNVTKYFPDPSGKGMQCIFKDIHFQIEQGTFVTMVGHSGCGKSTILNIIAGLERASSGGVILDGREIDAPGLDRMVVFQNFALMPWMSVYENVRVAVKAAHPQWSGAEVDSHVAKYIEMVGLTGAESKRPAMLSGGMRQRVGLARAFSVEPKVLLLDEPFAQIDALTRGVIQEELVSIWMRTKNTVFMVTHDVDEAILLSDKIVLMTRGPEAEIAEVVDITIPRPRGRTTVIEHPDYYKIRNHIIHFLVERSHKKQSTGAGPSPRNGG
jgi:nitrate/nitrite transport system ATP-binding protein